MGEFFPAGVSCGEARDWLLRCVDSQVPLWARTSGSTGVPKCVQLSVAALRSSVAATMLELDGGVASARDGVGGAGSSWVLALPLSHIAGWLVVARAALTGGAVFEVPGVGGEPSGPYSSGPFSSGPFSAQTFLGAAEDAASSGVWHTALVPVQLQRIVADSQALSVLATARSVLVGGAAVDRRVLDVALAAGVKIRRTYGMTETCGGCVYDGVGLPGVQLSLEHGEGGLSRQSCGEGIVWVSGPMLADGYVDPATGVVGSGADSLAFVTDSDGVRWHRSNDLGRISADGVLQILGRADDVINSGGVKVPPLPVERAAAGVAGVAEVCVVGVPDVEWGEAVVAVIELADGVAASARFQSGQFESDIRAAIADAVPRTHRPKQVFFRTLPRRGIGKVDRQAVVQWVADVR